MMADSTATTSLSDQIKSVTEKIKALKTGKAEKALIDEQVALLKELNQQKAAASGAGSGSGAAESAQRKFELKTPKGTKDFTPEEMAIRENMFKTITSVFKRHGAVTIDTPVFELKVPFARYLASNGVGSIKRYHIAKVYRRDNPSVNKGRMREFYQCDFDIAGEHGPMLPDAEVLRVVIEILEALKIGGFKVKINHRKILDGMFQVCGVPDAKIRAISSAVDKLDKAPWADVKKEMVVEKGLDEAVADRIGEYVNLAGSGEICDILAADERLSQNKNAMAGVEDMRLLFKYLEIYGVKHKMVFDLSLARGLDYYTGVIYEAVFESTSEETSGVGSIAAGGRYDELVGMFSGKKIPCVGVSVGVERVFAILYNRFKSSKNHEKIRSTATEVFISVMTKSGELEQRLKIAAELWDNGISAEFFMKESPRKDAQDKAIERDLVPVSVVLKNDGVIQVVNNATKEMFTVARDEIVATVKKVLGK
ncbi:hypothetical protein HDU76_004501 [Blyttiomyces sp. JEL0837]|nr:hypothetical protein HDU76_004501 [Blyttiomyces sp. JEL0837]